MKCFAALLGMLQVARAYAKAMSNDIAFARDPSLMRQTEHAPHLRPALL